MEDIIMNHMLPTTTLHSDTDSPLTAVSVDTPGLYHLPMIIDLTNLTPIIDKIILHNKNKDVSYIQLFCSSYGGAVDAAFTLIDIMNVSKIPIYTIGTGFVASAATMIFTSGTKDHRIALPKSQYLTHMCTCSYSGRYADVLNTIQSHKHLHETAIEIYASRTKITNRKKAEAFFMGNADKYITAKEAVDCGLADKICTSLE